MFLTPDYLLLTSIEQCRCGARPQSQRRDHAGLTPASLHPFRFYVSDDNKKDRVALSRTGNTTTFNPSSRITFRIL